MAERPTAVTGAAALVGRGLTRVDEAVLVMDDGVITALGPAREVAVPHDAIVAAAPGHTLVPGFIDAHVHIGFFDPATIVARGVTTVRDLGWPPDDIWPLVRASASPGFDGPTVKAAGPMLTVEGGYPTRAAWAPPGTGWVIGSPEQGRGAVDELHAAGATVVKVALNPAVGPTLGRSELGAIVDRAHDRGLKVTGHTFGLDELDKALDAAMDELAHMLMSPESIPDDTMARMIEQGMAIVPTLSIFFGAGQRIAIENLNRFWSAGGRVVYGTDLGNEGPVPGIDQREVSAMTRAGMTPRAIISSATVDSAEWLGLESVGALGEGMDADVVALEGSALEDHQALTKVAMVWRKGRRVT